METVHLDSKVKLAELDDGTVAFPRSHGDAAQHVSKFARRYGHELLSGLVALLSRVTPERSGGRGWLPLRVGPLGQMKSRVLSIPRSIFQRTPVAIAVRSNTIRATHVGLEQLPFPGLNRAMKVGISEVRNAVAEITISS